jgi:hypothetical protein
MFSVAALLETINMYEKQLSHTKQLLDAVQRHRRSLMESAPTPSSPCRPYRGSGDACLEVTDGMSVDRLDVPVKGSYLGVDRINSLSQHVHLASTSAISRELKLQEKRRAEYRVAARPGQADSSPEKLTDGVVNEIRNEKLHNGGSSARSQLVYPLAAEQLRRPRRLLTDNADSSS